MFFLTPLVLQVTTCFILKHAKEFSNQPCHNPQADITQIELGR